MIIKSPFLTTMFKLVLAEFVVPHSRPYGYRAPTYVNMLVSPAWRGLSHIYGGKFKYYSNTNRGIVSLGLENNLLTFFPFRKLGQALRGINSHITRRTADHELGCISGWVI